MKKNIVLLIICIAWFCNSSFAQLPFEEEGSKRFRFAQTTIGGDFRFTPKTGSSYFLNSNGSRESYELGNSAWGRFIISGWHFWGHVDFYLGLPLLKLSESKFGENGNAFYNNGIETGMKLYPSRVSDNKLRPYIGISFNNTVFWQESNEQRNQNLIRNTFPLQIGLTYVKGKNIFDLGITYNYQIKHEYYISKTQKEVIELPRFNISVGWRTYFDLSLKDEPALLDGRLNDLGNKIESERKASGVSVGIGLSSPFYLDNEFNDKNYSYLGDIRFSNSFIDYGLGYYFHKPDIHINFAFRNYKSKLDIFDTEQIYHRTSIGFEVFKFLFDYHGFVPFIGPIASFDRNRLKVDVNDVNDFNHMEQGMRYGITLGWDIRQDKIQWLMLRTNLRYYPNYKLNISRNGNKFDQLEFNIIQAVFYPSRFNWVRKNKPKEW